MPALSCEASFTLEPRPSSFPPFAASSRFAARSERISRACATVIFFQSGTEPLTGQRFLAAGSSKFCRTISAARRKMACACSWLSPMAKGASAKRSPAPRRSSSSTIFDGTGSGCSCTAAPIISFGDVMALTQHRICFSRMDFIAGSEQNKYIMHKIVAIYIAIFGCNKTFSAS
jgi:hypothetical protein